MLPAGGKGCASRTHVGGSMHAPTRRKHARSCRCTQAAARRPCPSGAHHRSMRRQAAAVRGATRAARPPPSCCGGARPAPSCRGPGAGPAHGAWGCPHACWMPCMRGMWQAQLCAAYLQPRKLHAAAPSRPLSAHSCRAADGDASAGQRVRQQRRDTRGLHVCVRQGQARGCVRVRGRLLTLAAAKPSTRVLDAMGAAF